MFECFHCGERAVSWDADFDAEDYGYESDGVIQELHCNNCGANITYEVFNKKETEEEMKIFISMPMQGKTEEEVKTQFSEYGKQLLEEYPGAKIINSIQDDFKSENSKPNEAVKCLAKGLELLADADIVFFAPDFENARGCEVEMHVARAYGKAVKIG